MDTPSSGQQTSTLFISYSRKDKEFVRRLNDALDKAGYTAWVDWEGIAPSADWREEIRHAVQSTDAIVFVLSPDFAKSKECDFEVKLALEYNKKLIPVMYRPLPKGAVLHEKLSATNWIFMREGDRFKSGVDKIVESVRTDLEWVRLHTRLLQRALEWEERGRSNSSLLMGAELDEAERWMTEAASQEGREVLPLQAEYIAASRRGVVRRGQRLLIGVSFALAVSIALGLYALALRGVAMRNEQTAIVQSNARATQQVIAEEAAIRADKNAAEAEANALEAQANEITARAQRSAAQAQLYLNQPGQLDTSMLLALASWQREQTPQAENLLRYGLSQLPPPLAQMRQNDGITRILFTPDDQSIVTASLDGAACVWTLSGAQRFCVQHDAGVSDAILVRDGQVLVTGSDDGSVRLWSMSEGSPLGRYDLRSSVHDLDISPDGLWLAAGREDGGISIVNLNVDRLVTTVYVRGAALTLAFSPNSAWLAIGTDLGNVQLWRVMTEIFLSGPRHVDAVYAVAFSPDGRWVVSGGADGYARAALTEVGGQLLAMAHDDYVEALDFGPANAWFATASDDQLVRVWSLKTGQELLRMAHADYVQAIQVSPDGKWITTTGLDQTVRAWDANSGAQMLQIQLDNWGIALAFNRDGTQLAVGDVKGNVSIWNISSLAMLAHTYELPQVVHRALFVPNGGLVVNVDDKTVVSFSAEQSQPEIALRLASLTYDMAVSPDGQWLAVPEDGLNRIILYDRASRTSSYIPHESNVIAVAFSPDSRQVALGGKDGGISIWKVSPGERVISFSVSSDVQSLAFHPKGRWLAVGLSTEGAIGRTVIRDLQAGQDSIELLQPGDIKTAVFSPDGRWLVTSGPGGGLYIWNAGSDMFDLAGKLLLDTAGLSAAFHPTRPLLAVGGGNATLYLIDLDLMQEIGRVPQAAGITGVSFSEEGDRLAVASARAVKLLNVDLIPLGLRETLAENVCSRLTINLSHEQWEQLFFDESYRLICPLLPEGAR